MPPIDEEFVLKGLKQLLRIDADWVPHLPGTSVYIRPTMIATEPFLGVHPAHQFKFFIILCAVGPYYPNGFSPISIYVEPKYTRAAEGGTGNVKSAGNYAVSLKAANEAQTKGFTQVLWLDGKEHKWIEEIGMMNIVFVFKNEIVTPELDGNILAGITRDSVLQLCKERGLKVSERRISIDEVIQGTKTGDLQECFGTGTAAVIAPIGTLAYKDQTYTVSQNSVGRLTRSLYEELTGIQYGLRPDPFGWIVPI
jgi:branched-chain amino acid aminotransferase